MSFTVRGKLLGIAVAGAVLALAVGGAGLVGVRQMGAAMELTNRLDAAPRYHQDIDQGQDAIKHEVFGAILVGSGVKYDDRADIQPALDPAAARFRANLAALSRVPLPPCPWSWP